MACGRTIINQKLYRMSDEVAIDYYEVLFQYLYGSNKKKITTEL
jgi:hypothetical protein